jgi:hypothetical protein
VFWVTNRAERRLYVTKSCSYFLKKRHLQWSQLFLSQLPFLDMVNWHTIECLRLIGVFVVRVAISADNVVRRVLIEHDPDRYPEIIIQRTQLEVAMATDVGSLCWFGFTILIEYTLSCVLALVFGIHCAGCRSNC